MTTESENKETTKNRGPLYEATRTVLLAGIGAISLAQDGINNFIDQLVERGEMAETDARKLAREVMERRDSLEKERRQQVQEQKHAAGASRADVEALNARIADLTRQIEELRGRQERQDLNDGD